jgi:hypothetical protein
MLIVIREICVNSCLLFIENFRPEFHELKENKIIDFRSKEFRHELTQITLEYNISVLLIKDFQ